MSASSSCTFALTLEPSAIADCAGGLPDTLAFEQADDSAGIDLDRHTLQHVPLAVVGAANQ
jgi:hypothetical protein